MFVKVTNGQIDQYPYTVGDLRRDNPNTSFPKVIPDGVLADFGVFPVGYDAAPEYDPMTHRLEHSSVPVLKDGKWMLTKTVVALTTEQIADRDASMAASVRKERDRKLAETDWMALSDVTMSEEMATYRQALRDITAQEGFPHSVNWPVKP
jgi:hypothetical protein